MNSEQKTRKSFKQEALELLRFTLIVLAIVIPIRVFIAQPFIVNGESMIPTLDNGDYLIIDQITYKQRTPERGEVVVFRFPSNQRRFLIKRIIGLPGETVGINGSRVTITDADGNVIQLEEESYLNREFSSYGTWSLGSDEYFVMGDNRQKSSDSRSWGILKEDLIVGKTFLRLFPLGNFDYQPAEIEASQIELAL
ncbi:MAG: signal peptidase I [Candidatus Pacebacteria bacterium]|nr:signal peptidase I [Candidatus Paceibacterota bacterium]